MSGAVSWMVVAAAIGMAHGWAFQAAAQEGGKSQGLSLSIGVGALMNPSYLGDNAYQLITVPNIQISYADRISLSIEGLTANLINQNGWRLGPVLKYDAGRDEDGDSLFRIAGNSTDDLEGLGDVDGTFELGGFIEYGVGPLKANIELRQGVNGHEGLIAEVKADYGQPFKVLKQPIMTSIGPRLTIVDSNYNDAFFSVDANQSALSGLDEFDAGGGVLSYGVAGAVILPLTNHVSTVLFGGYTRLAGDAAESSLVQDRGSPNQGQIGFFLNYEF